MQARRLPRADGPALMADIGDRDGEDAIVLLHGAGESRHIWGPVARALKARGRNVVTLDLRGHGDSENAPEGDYSLAAFIADLHHALDALSIPRAVLVGQRLGAAIALGAAAAAGATRVRGLAMIDFGLDATARRRRRERALIGAGRTSYANLAEAAAIVAPHRPRLQSEANLRRVLQQDAVGRWSWRCDPAFTAADAGQRVDLERDGPALLAALSKVQAPMLLVRASASELLTPAHAMSLKAHAPHLQYADLTSDPEALIPALIEFTADTAAADPPNAAFDQTMLRRALGCFATGVAILTATDGEGRPVGLTANSFCSVSLDPPLVLFCLDRRAGSLPAFERATSFAVNILHSDQRDVSSRFVAKNIDRFADTGWETWETAAPIVQDAMVKLECEKFSALDGGDHRIFIGRVRDLWFDPAREPLLYFQGKYRRLDSAP